MASMSEKALKRQRRVTGVVNAPYQMRGTPDALNPSSNFHCTTREMNSRLGKNPNVAHHPMNGTKLPASDKLEGENLKTVGLMILVSPFTVVIGSLANGFTLSTLWQWFIVPAFSVTPISVETAAGLLMIINYARTNPNKKAASSGKSFSAVIMEWLSFTTLGNAMVLGFAWLIQKVL
jgi:hypothetical protein